MLVDVEKFMRILDIHLPEKNNENVLEAIKLLENGEDILYAGADYYMEITSLPYHEPDYYSWQESALESISLPDAWKPLLATPTLWPVFWIPAYKRIIRHYMTW